jgi:hypothetical protein
MRSVPATLYVREGRIMKKIGFDVVEEIAKLDGTKKKTDDAAAYCRPTARVQRFGVGFIEFYLQNPRNPFN